MTRKETFIKKVRLSNASKVLEGTQKRLLDPCDRRTLGTFGNHFSEVWDQIPDWSWWSWAPQILVTRWKPRNKITVQESSRVEEWLQQKSERDKRKMMKMLAREEIIWWGKSPKRRNKGTWSKNARAPLEQRKFVLRGGRGEKEDREERYMEIKRCLRL